MKLSDIQHRNANARLWQRDIWNDIIITKWADLWPEDVKDMLSLVNRLNSQPKDINEYRNWLSTAKEIVHD